MANYAPIRPAPDSWIVIPALPVDTDLQAVNGAFYLSSDAVPSQGSAIILRPLSGLYRIAANRELRCSPVSGGGQLVRMDS